MSIVTDKPFVIGDSITVNSYSGKVEYIGLNTRFVRWSLTAIGTMTIDFTTRYYLTDPAYQVYADAQQTVMLEIMRKLKADGTTLGVEVEGAMKEKVAGLRDPMPVG